MKKQYKKAWRKMSDVYAEVLPPDFTLLDREEQIAASSWFGDMQALLGIIIPRLRFQPKQGFGGDNRQPVRGAKPLIDVLELANSLCTDAQHALPSDVVKEALRRRKEAWQEKQVHPQGTYDEAQKQADDAQEGSDWIKRRAGELLQYAKARGLYYSETDAMHDAEVQYRQLKESGEAPPVGIVQDSDRCFDCGAIGDCSHRSTPSELAQESRPKRRTQKPKQNASARKRKR